MITNNPYYANLDLVISLMPWLDNPRGEIGDLAGLKASLKAMGGSMTPLIVYPDPEMTCDGGCACQDDDCGDQRYIILDGNRRYYALEQILLNDGVDLPLHPDMMVHCLVIPDAATNVALRYQIAAASDSTKVGWLPSMTVQAYTDMHQAGATFDTIAATTGTTAKEVSQALLVGATVFEHADMCTAVDNGEMPYEAGVIVALYTARLSAYPGAIFANTLDNLWLSWTQQKPHDMTEWARRVAVISGVHTPVDAGDPVERVKRTRTRYQLPKHMHEHAAKLYEELDGGKRELAQADVELLCATLAPYYQQYGAALGVSHAG